MSHRRDPLTSDLLFNGQLKQASRRRRTKLARVPSLVPRRNDLVPTLTLVHLAIAELHSAPRKLRAYAEAHVRGVANSISTLGFCAPVLIGRDNRVIDGEVRLEAARALGLAEVPCLRVDHLSEAEQRLLRLAINRLGEQGEWQLDALKLELEELILDEAPITISGFEPTDIDQILIGDEADVVEQGSLEPATAIAVSRLGDVFELGPHRIVCGDARDPAVMSILMPPEETCRLVLTDEPYNVPIQGHVSGGDHREFAMASGEMTSKQFRSFNHDWMATALSRLCDGGVLGTFIDWRGLTSVCLAATGLDLLPINLVVWAKTNAGMGSLYRSQHELLPLFKKGKAAFVNNVELGAKGRWRSNLWTYPGASSIGSDARRGLRDHPTVKPTAMLEDALLDLTHRGDIVLDPFLGSGSTLMAAQRTGRVCRGIELDPLYVDVIVRRFRDSTGLQAQLAGTGESFDSLAKGRQQTVVEPDNPPSITGCDP